MDIKLYDFCVWNDDEGKKVQGKDNKKFIIQMFGMKKNGQTVSVIVKGFHPFFYVKVGSSWNERTKRCFLTEIKIKLRTADAEYQYDRLEKEGKTPKNRETGKAFSKKEYVDFRLDQNKPCYYEDSILSFKLVKKRKLYGFDAKKKYNFVKLVFTNISAFNKVKNLWYKGSDWKKRRLCEPIFVGTKTQLYEAKLPPLLRFFHITNISPTGWIRLLDYDASDFKLTNCDFNVMLHYNKIKSLPDKEDPVPLKICSFDIEASSSHGDFPLAIKRYEKLAGDILDYWDEDCDAETLKNIILVAFNFMVDEDNLIHEVFPKRRITEENLRKRISKMNLVKLSEYLHSNVKRGDKYEHLCHRPAKKSEFGSPAKKAKIGILPIHLPPLKGDIVTFIGSSFMKMGEEEPYLNHCIALNTCDDVDGSEIECYENESDVLLKWRDLIQKEKPHIIIGYNIFGFDWKFLFERADELGCKDEFLNISKIQDHICKPVNKTIKIASGEHNLQYPDIPGIVQLDLYNYFRRQYNFQSYKLDNVSKELIGDGVKGIEVCDGLTKIESSNLTGLKVGHYICLEEIQHCTDLYKEGKKMKVCKMGEKCFYIEGAEEPDMNKKVRWCLAKDDVTPEDIFRLSNEGSAERAIVAKYCIMDCVLVHMLAKKVDVFTGFIEMGNINTVPISFIVFRGQGIKLFSLIAKTCRENKILMPVLKRDWRDKSGYEGAICLNPKADLYIDDPVAVVDYAGLYPSSMISENLSQDSKVWTREYNLEKDLIKETGEKDHDGSFKYDNLSDYKYVDIEYDVFKYIRKTEKSAAVKTKVGNKICRFAQFPNGEKAILPAVLTSLLKARKETRALIKYKTVKVGKDVYSGLVSKSDNKTTIKQKNGKIITVDSSDIDEITDTYNDFMKGVFNQRQLGFKVTANSIYGQTGAMTSDFYDKDIAASTTATGRKLLTYAKRVLEEVYNNRVCETKHGKVNVTADVVYGDTDSCFFKFDITDMEGNKIIGKKALEITIEIAIEAGELATTMLKEPHDLEYEKTFLPFILLSKKRYVGILYETNPNKGKRKSMGIVLKRRDNAGVVKEIYGGVIDILTKDGDVVAAVNFVNESLKKLADGGYPMEKLKITKSLRGFYKNPSQIAHKVLADRMTKRDPGNKPSAGTRIPYVYIVNKAGKLQGDRIETPEFIVKNDLKIDYAHYITNQIMKPILQVFALDNVMRQIPGVNKFKLNALKRNIKKTIENTDKDKVYKKTEDLKTKFVKKIVFDPILKKIKDVQKNDAKKKFISSFFELKK